MAKRGGRLRGLGRGMLFVAALSPHLRHPITHREAREVVRRRLDARANDFLALVQRGVFRNPRSPYVPLFRRARCTFADLVDLVSREGVEGALATLLAEGVFFTNAEIKGLSPVVRGALSFPLHLEQLRNPAWMAPHPVSGRRVPRYRAFFADLAVNATLTLHARGGTGWTTGVWFRSVRPSGLVWLLRHQGAGYGPDRWFVRLDPASHRDEAWLGTFVQLVSRWAGRPLPAAQPVPLADATPVVTWMRDALRAGRTPHLAVATSIAVEICEMARRLGVDLTGARFGVSSDPITETRLAAIRRSGAEAVPSYGAAETGLIASGCLDPAQPDDMHLYDDVHAVIQPGPAGAAGIPARGLLFSSLRGSTPYVLLNVSLGDQATLVARACGCALEAIGWRTHLHSVRSFEKMKVGGTIVLVEPIVRLLEQTLPERFGGGATDYQLVEDDDVVDGTPRLRLVIHPRVGRVPDEAVGEVFVTAVRAAGVPVDRLWRDRRWLVVERRPPYETGHGKIYHVHRPGEHVPGMIGEA
jgi:hypothetical protein